MTGSLSVLNCGAGDIEVRFNRHQPEEVARAIAMLKDMQRQGYAILVKNDDGSYSRAVDIDEERGLYIISGSPTASEDIAPVEPEARKRGRQKRRTAPIATSSAVGVARSAGG